VCRRTCVRNRRKKKESERTVERESERHGDR